MIQGIPKRIKEKRTEKAIIYLTPTEKKNAEEIAADTT